MQRSVGVVIPAYEPAAERLESYVRAIDAEIEPAAIRIELDAPAPGLRRRLEALPAEVHAVAVRRGKGAAVTAGFEALATEVRCFADADGSIPVGSLAAVIEPTLERHADLSVGSRRHPGATLESHQTYARRWMGHGFAWLARRLLDVRLTDYQCGAKAIDAEAWRRVRGHLYEPGFGWDVELVAMAGALGLDVVEVPVVWCDQPRSTVSPVRTPFELLRALLAARHRAALLAEHPLHDALDAYRSDHPPLVEQLAAER